MKRDTKQQYRAPETTEHELKIERSILYSTGTPDPLIPEDI